MRTMAKFLQETAGKGGWSRWVPPVMSGYKMACCDCGLVHDMQFKAVRVTKREKDGSWRYRDLNRKEFRVIFRAKINSRSTAAMRRKKENRK